MICKDCKYFSEKYYRYNKGHCTLDGSDKYFEDMACNDFESEIDLDNLTDEQLEQAIEAIKKAADAITEAMVKFTEAIKESVNSIDWNAILEAMQEEEEYPEYLEEDIHDILSEAYGKLEKGNRN